TFLCGFFARTARRNGSYSLQKPQETRWQRGPSLSLPRWSRWISSKALARAVSSPTRSTGQGVGLTCQTASIRASSAIGSLGYFSASSRSFRATAKWCLYARPTNFSRSSSFEGALVPGVLSYSFFSAAYCSAGVGNLSWPLPSATTSDRVSIGSRIVKASPFICVSPLFPPDPGAGRRAAPVGGRIPLAPAAARQLQRKFGRRPLQPVAKAAQLSLLVRPPPASSARRGRRVVGMSHAVSGRSDRRAFTGRLQ